MPGACPAVVRPRTPGCGPRAEPERTGGAVLIEKSLEIRNQGLRWSSSVQNVQSPDSGSSTRPRHVPVASGAGRLAVGINRGFCASRPIEPESDARATTQAIVVLSSVHARQCDPGPGGRGALFRRSGVRVRRGRIGPGRRRGSCAAASRCGKLPDGRERPAPGRTACARPPATF